MLHAANGEDPLVREAVRHQILNHGGDVPQDFLNEAARSTRYASIAQALLTTVDRMSYSSRKSLATKFQKIGRDDAVITCLATSPVQDGEGLLTLCEASLRGRFIGAVGDIEPSLFAASFEEARAEVRWIQQYSRREKKGRELDRSVARLIDLAEREKHPCAYNALGEMLLSNDLTAATPGVAELCFRTAALNGYAPAKLNLLRHFPGEKNGDAIRYLADFYNESYFPGLAWCFAALRSEGEPLRHIDAILKCYLWHPDLSVGSTKGIVEAVRMAEELSTIDSSTVAQWALRNDVLVMDGRYPAVCTE